jgi:hypothetical protein
MSGCSSEPVNRRSMLRGGVGEMALPAGRTYPNVRY